MNVARTATSAAADRIRIEDEVWEEAFASRVSSRRRRSGEIELRPAPNWFADPSDRPRPYGVDPPAGVGVPFDVDTPFGVDAPLEVAAPLDLGAPYAVDAPYGVAARSAVGTPLSTPSPVAAAPVRSARRTPRPVTSVPQAGRAAPGPTAAPSATIPPAQSTGVAPAASPTVAPVRRTIRIQGRGAERHLPVTGRDQYRAAANRRPSSLLDHRSGFQPDRLAMWAMFLGVALVVVAILSSSL